MYLTQHHSRAKRGEGQVKSDNVQTARGLAKVAEVAEYLGLSRAAVYRLMDRGELPYAKLGYARRVRWSDVESYITASMVQRDAC